MSEPFEDLRREQEGFARARFAQRSAEREQHVEALSEPGGLVKVNSGEELARRLARVTRYYAGESLPTTATQPPGAVAAPDEVIDAALERATSRTSEAAPGVAAKAALAAAAVTAGMESAT